MKFTGRLNLFMKLAVVAFVVFSLITIVQLQIRFNKLRRQAEEMEAQILRYEDRIDELNERLEQSPDREYALRVAREQLSYCYPDEFIVYNDR